MTGGQQGCEQLIVLRGKPDPAELAALTVLLSALAGQQYRQPSAPAPATPRWNLQVPAPRAHRGHRWLQAVPAPRSDRAGRWSPGTRGATLDDSHSSWRTA